MTAALGRFCLYLNQLICAVHTVRVSALLTTVSLFHIKSAVCVCVCVCVCVLLEAFITYTVKMETICCGAFHFYLFNSSWTWVSTRWPPITASHPQVNMFLCVTAFGWLTERTQVGNVPVWRCHDDELCLRPPLWKKKCKLSNTVGVTESVCVSASVWCSGNTQSRREGHDKSLQTCLWL